MGIPLHPGIRRVLDRPNIAHLATLQPDGAPKSDPVWILRDEDRVVVGTHTDSLKARNAAHDPRVAVSVVDRDNPYEEVQLRGVVIDHEPDFELEVMDRIARKYTGEEFPWRIGHGRVALIIDVTQARHHILPITGAPPEG
jgi:PPOX class probable F420-dependent enzyme